jgi:signal transduction histidine kinase
LKDHGAVTLRLRGPDAGDSLRVGAVVLDVEDNGQGMDEETQVHAAEPYFTTKSDGHGLGLSTVFGIAQRYGGGVRLRSTQGQGTCVSVAFQRRS